MNINSDNKTHVVSKIKCSTPDAKMEKMMLKNLEQESNKVHTNKPLI